MGLLDSIFDPETMAAVSQINQPSEEQQRQARNNALMNAGFAMMMNNGGVNKQQALFNALGAGGMAGIGAYGQSIQDARQQNAAPLQTALAIKRLQKENLPAGMIMGEDGKPKWIDGYLDGMEQMRQGKQTPYFVPLSTPQGVMSFDSRTGNATPIGGSGAPIMKASDDPTLQGKIAGAKEGAKIRAESETTAQIEMPKVVQQADETINLVDSLIKHPGRETATGLSSRLDPRNYVPGTNAKDFQIRLDQIKGKQFLQAFESLKGGGQITEVEGKKATDAISRMNTAASDKEFLAAAEEFKGIVTKAKERAINKAQMPDAVQYPSNAGLPGVKVPNGVEQRGAILSQELQQEQSRLAQARSSGDLRGISEANRNIQLLQREMGMTGKAAPAQEAPKVRRYNPQTGRIE